MGVAQRLHRLQELRPQVVVAALGLDRLGDEARDVVRMRLERRLSLSQRMGLGGLDARQVLIEREGHRR